MSFGRASGILLHPTSLPSRGGIGDFGPAAYQFVDFLARARQGIWQVLPLGPIGFGKSPYSAASALAGTPLLISLERLGEHGWIGPEKLSGLSTDSRFVEYDQVFARKMPLLFEAARHFVASAADAERERFTGFRHDNAWWLEDFVLFDAMRARYKLQSWNEWPNELARRDPVALKQVRQELADDVAIRAALQFAFPEQWWALRHNCAEPPLCHGGAVCIPCNDATAT